MYTFPTQIALNSLLTTASLVGFAAIILSLLIFYSRMTNGKKVTFWKTVQMPAVILVALFLCMLIKAYIDNSYKTYFESGTSVVDNIDALEKRGWFTSRIVYVAKLNTGNLFEFSNPADIKIGDTLQRVTLPNGVVYGFKRKDLGFRIEKQSDIHFSKQ